MRLARRVPQLGLRLDCLRIPTGTSALALFSDFQPSLGGQFSQSLLRAPRSEQRYFLRSEPLLGDAHQLLERVITGLAEELDRSGRLSEPYPVRQVVDDAAPTRPRTGALTTSNHLS